MIEALGPKCAQTPAKHPRSRSGRKAAADAACDHRPPAVR